LNGFPDVTIENANSTPAFAQRDRRSPLELWWATPAAARDYSPSRLRDADVPRAGLRRGARADLEWRVSRALLGQALPENDENAGPAGWPPAALHLAWSLSHRAGHALVATAPPGWRVGVDLETLRPRDVERLARWCCGEQEIGQLLRLDEAGRLEHFYVLWTIKEAFVKAAGLAFPADMKRVGLAGAALRAPPGCWYAASWAIGAAWIASAVWTDAPSNENRSDQSEKSDFENGASAEAVAAAPGWRAGRRDTVPPRRLLGVWCSGSQRDFGEPAGSGCGIESGRQE
jgi:4'-phosphopantetheinyl transferase